jgi:hypothetical protein
MKEDARWKLMAGAGLLALSLILFAIHYLIFHDEHHIFIFFMGDLAFIPIEILVVTLIIDRLLESREKKMRMEKLNMVIGTFFSTLGTPLLSMLSCADEGVGAIRDNLVIGKDWDRGRFSEVHTSVLSRRCKVPADRIDLEALKSLLTGNQDFLLRLLENPMVFEHESFTDLLLAVTHLTEELKAREELNQLLPTDLAHLSVDIGRVYERLVPEWLKYMEYLKGHYPYLFSLAMRQNPFDTAASVVVKS